MDLVVWLDKVKCTIVLWIVVLCISYRVICKIWCWSQAYDYLLRYRVLILFYGLCQIILLSVTMTMPYVSFIYCCQYVSQKSLRFSIVAGLLHTTLTMVI